MRHRYVGRYLTQQNHFVSGMSAGPKRSSTNKEA